jgi:hypothetical protein
MLPPIRRDVRAIAEALFTTEQGPPPTERLDWLLEELEDFLDRVGSGTRLGLYGAAAALAALTPLAALHPEPIAAMPLSLRIEALNKIEGGPASGLVLALKAILCILYYEHPEAAREVGFDGACMVEEAA